MFSTKHWMNCNALKSGKALIIYWTPILTAKAVKYLSNFGSADKTAVLSCGGKQLKTCSKQQVCKFVCNSITSIVGKWMPHPTNIQYENISSLVVILSRRLLTAGMYIFEGVTSKETFIFDKKKSLLPVLCDLHFWQTAVPLDRRLGLKGFRILTHGLFISKFKMISWNNHD